MRRESGNEMAQLVVRETLEEGSGELSSKEPVVLSCGGIYIPYDKRKKLNHPLWQILNLPDQEQSVKIVAAEKPKSPLSLILAKERMN